MGSGTIRGERWVLELGRAGYPDCLVESPNPPERLFGIGDPAALRPGLAVIGARRATPYGRSCARRFAGMAARKGVAIVSGGARGCDSEAHRAALEAGGITVAVLGGGCDEVYPAENLGLFQRIADAGGAVVSEHEWRFPPKPYTFRARNRIIAGLARAVLIVEAGLPSGTFSTADEALEASRDVLVVPGSIASASSRGSNRLIYQGATPIVDDETFEDQLLVCFGALKSPPQAGSPAGSRSGENAQARSDPLVEAVRAQPMGLDALLALSASLFGEDRARSEMMRRLVEAEAAGAIARQPDGLWGPVAGK